MCTMGSWLSWESAAFATQRSRVRIPYRPPNRYRVSRPAGKQEEKHGLFFGKIEKYPSLAHLDRVSDSDSEGGGFESRRTDHFVKQREIVVSLFYAQNFRELNNFFQK